ADPIVAHVATQGLIALRAGEPCLARMTPGTLRALGELHEPEVVRKVIDQLAANPDSARRSSLLRLLCRLYFREADWDGRWWGTRPDTTGPYFKPAAWEMSETIGRRLKEELATADGPALRALLSELQRHRISFPEIVPIVLKLAGQDSAFRPTAADLLGRMSPMPPEAVALLEETAATGDSRSLTALIRANRPDASEAAIRVMTT